MDNTYLIASIPKGSKFPLYLSSHISNIVPDEFNIRYGWILWDVSGVEPGTIEKMIVNIQTKFSKYYFHTKITFQIYDL